MENFYARQVRAAGDGRLLPQAFTDTFGHCNFSPAELLAGVLALSHRVTTGHWDQAADPGTLNHVAASLGLGPARFAERYYPRTADWRHRIEQLPAHPPMRRNGMRVRSGRGRT